MNSRMAAIAIVLLLCNASAFADVISLTPSKDNTIFSKNDAASNALGILFTNTTNQGNTRRALLAFDVASQVPVGSTVTSASLTLNLHEAAPESGTLEHQLHRLQQDWGEGNSYATSGNGAAATPGDATWANRFYPDTLWTTPGGDFVATPSASSLVGETPAPVTWGSTPGMVADVQSWLDSPNDNYGWILLGDEAQLGAARKFVNREVADPALRPVLTIEFTPPSYPDTVVPTLSRLGLAILTLLMLAAAGIVRLRRAS